MDKHKLKCQKCGNEISTIVFSNHGYRTPIYEGRKIYDCDIHKISDQFDFVAGEIVENKIKKGVLGIKNLSNKTWNVKMQDGNFYSVSAGNGFPIWDGLEIDFGEVTAKM